MDDSAAVRDAICQFIDRATPYQACCEAGNGVAAIEKARERAPALVILDLSMPMLYGVETASTLRRMVPGTKIIGLSMFAGEFRRTQLAAAVESALASGTASTSNGIAGARADVCLQVTNVLFAVGGLAGVFGGRPSYLDPLCTIPQPQPPSGNTAATFIRTEVAGFRRRM